MVKLWYFGSHHGSQINHSWYYVFKTGFKEWPELYAMVVYMTAGTVLLTRNAYLTIKNKDYMCRYKRVYHVVRPNDPRLQLYPRKYITDKQYLGPDHPESTNDLKMIQLPICDVHKYDPTVRGKGRDRD